MPIDYSKYPSNWKEIRKRILEMSKNRCEFKGCDFEHGEIVKSVISNGKTLGWFRSLSGFSSFSKGTKIKNVKVIITIAHLDHDETNNNITDDRLMAMCQLHHLRYDAKEKSERRNGMK